MRLELYAPGASLQGDTVVIPPGLAETPSTESLESLRAYARGGGRLLALGDGVALLCAAALLPGMLTEAPLEALTHVRVEGRATPFTWAIPAGRILALAGAPRHRYAAPGADVSALAAKGRILFRFCDASGGVASGEEPAATIAGLCDDSGRVVGILGGVSQALDCALGRQIGACLGRA